MENRFKGEEFGKAVKKKRTIDEGLTLRELADQLSRKKPIAYVTISRIESGKTAELSPILILCDWLGRSICDFFFDGSKKGK